MNVPRICMGCMGFGDPGQGQHTWTLDEEHSRQIIKRGLEPDVKFYDTAIGYQSGDSEKYVGRAPRDFARRDGVVVTSKFLPRAQDEIEAVVTGQQHIERTLNKSLENLGMDYVDLDIYHIEDILDGPNRKVKAGKARYIGIFKGKVDYHTFKPVLFEFPTYEYFVTGEKVGDCGRMSVE